MNTRISRTVLGGAVCLIITFASTQFPARAGRARNEAKKEESRGEFILKLRQDLKAAISSARDPRERKLYEYELQIFEHAETKGEIASMLRFADGVDQLEALILAKEYFLSEFGACGFVDLPEKDGASWKVAIAAGLEARPQSPIIIDAPSGIIRCAGHRTVSDAESFMRGLNSTSQP